MPVTNEIRVLRWVGICALYLAALPSLIRADTDTSTPPPSPAQTPSTAAKKPKHPVSGQATTEQSASHTSTQKSKRSRGKKVAGKRGQQAIDSPRAREIQSALIREHYLQGQPTGTWDSASQAAMQRYQADHGWQSKTTPDARALIRLGLGPSHDHLLNPESAMTGTNSSPDAQSDAARHPAQDSPRDPKTATKPAPADTTPQP